MSNVILGNNFYFGSLFFGATWTISSMGKEKKMVKFASQINLKLTLVTVRNVLSSNHFCNQFDM
jgi:hypothetical protein